MDEPQQLELAVAAGLPVADLLGELGSSDEGLSSAEAGRRLAAYGPNMLLSPASALLWFDRARSKESSCPTEATVHKVARPRMSQSRSAIADLIE
jgi:Cation transporter/ATPase, N-terminus